MQKQKFLGFAGVVSFAAALSACGSPDPVPYSGTKGQKAAEPPTTETEAYPEGPYGINVGSVVEPFEFYGFHNPALSADPSNLEPFSLADFYNPDGNATWPADSVYRPGELKPTVLLIDVSAFWCPPCQMESRDILPGDYAEFQPRGAEFFLQLADGHDYGVPATPSELKTWTSTYHTAWPAAIDPTNKLSPLFEADVFPANFLIDTSTMKIVDRVAGVPPATDAFYTKLKSLLRPE